MSTSVMFFFFLSHTLICFPLAADCEITLEGRINRFSDEMFERALEGGFNRFSFGVQSFAIFIRDDKAHTAAGVQMLLSSWNTRTL